MSYAQWNPTTTYVVNDVVEYAGFIYQAVAISLGVPPFPVNPKWTLIGPSSGGVVQTLSLTGNNISLNPSGGAVDVALATTVADTAYKTTQQTYNAGAFLETEFGGQVKVNANIISAPPLGGSVVLEGGLSKVAIGSADASITAPAVEFQDGATLGIASVAYDGTQINVDTQLNAGANLVKSSAVPSANDDLVNKLYVDGLFPPTADTLANVLLAGNNAGATSIDMNQQDINSVANIYMRDDTDDTPNIYFTKTGTTKARIEYNGNGTNDFISMTGDSVVLDFAKGNLELNSSLFARIQTQDSLPIRLVRETSAPILPETVLELAGSGQVVIGAVGSGITAPSILLQGDAGGSSYTMTLDNTLNLVNTTGLEVFSTLPQCSAVPSLGDELVNKTYVDGLFPPPTIDITDTSTNTTYYPTFVDGAGANKTMYVDATATALTYNPSTDTLTSANFDGKVKINNTNANATHYLSFSDNHTTAFYGLQATSGISCNPNASSITATTFNGALNGNATTATTATSATSATNATNIAITDTDTNATYYPTFVDSAGTGKTLRADITTSPLTYNPSTGVMTFSNPPQTSVAPSVGNDITNKTYVDGTASQFFFTDFNSLDAGYFVWSSSGAGTGSMFNGTFDASISSVALRRTGFLNMNSTATSGNNLYFQSANATWNPVGMKSITWGFIPLGNGSLSAVGADAGNINQAMAVALTTSATDSQATFIGWRLASATASIPTWTLVENNVVKETLSGTNLTGGLTNKFCRASIYFTNNGANYYGVWTNLTDGATYTTATYATSTPNTFCQLYLHCGTTNNTAKQIAFDYLLVENNCLPIGGTTSSATSR